MIHLGCVFLGNYGVKTQQAPWQDRDRQRQASECRGKACWSTDRTKKSSWGRTKPRLCLHRITLCFSMWLFQIHRRRIWFNIKPASRADGAEVALAESAPCAGAAPLWNKNHYHHYFTQCRNHNYSNIRSLFLKKNPKHFALMQCYNIPNQTFC